MHISHITHTEPKYTWGVYGVQAVDMSAIESSKIQVPNVKFCPVARYCFTIFLDPLPFRVSLVGFCIDSDSHCFLHVSQ
eukprot:bmy_15917T0